MISLEEIKQKTYMLTRSALLHDRKLYWLIVKENRISLRIKDLGDWLINTVEY